MSEIDPFELQPIETNLEAKRCRVLFTLSEKVCLQKLILQYRIHRKKLSISCRKTAWARLTQDFNSIKGFNRTEAQLRKCWENIQSRRKPKHRLRGRLTASEEDLDLEGAELFSDPLMPVKQEETAWNNVDDDFVTKEFAEVPPGGCGASPALAADFLPLADRLQAESPGPPSPGRHEAARLTDAFAARLRGTTDYAGNQQHAHNNTGSKPTNRDQERIEELHKLKVAEQIWTLKTLRERHATAQIERERAKLERQRAHGDSERVKLELEKARFERDAAQYQREKALLDLDRAKRLEADVTYR